MRQPAQAGQSALDYSLTLGRVEKALQAIAGHLETVEARAALTLTPRCSYTETDSVACAVTGAARRSFADAVHALQVAGRGLKGWRDRYVRGGTSRNGWRSPGQSA